MGGVRVEEATHKEGRVRDGEEGEKLEDGVVGEVEERRGGELGIPIGEVVSEVVVHLVEVEFFVLGREAEYHIGSVEVDVEHPSDADIESLERNKTH